jgi:hypothetical protein
MASRFFTPAYVPAPALLFSMFTRTDSFHTLLFPVKNKASREENRKFINEKLDNPGLSY